METPVIITRTPYRVSFFGGGSDYPAWYREHGGAVLTSTIDRYCHVLVRYMPSFLGAKYIVFWSKMEKVNTLAEIQHAGVRGCLEYLGIDEGFEVNHAGDLPARSGLGSSSAFTVGMLHALHALQHRFVGKERLAREAVHVEQDILRETVGIQDQIECAHGGLNLIEIARDGSYSVRPLVMPRYLRDEFEGRLMLFFTGLQRHASEIAESQMNNVNRKEAELHRIAALVPRAVECLTFGDFDRFGHLLHETWELKRVLSDKVTNPEIDGIYTRAREAGAVGGKLLGAGGGGFMLLYVPVEKQAAVREALSDLLSVPVKFENSGSQVVLFDQ